MVYRYQTRWSEKVSQKQQWNTGKCEIYSGHWVGNWYEVTLLYLIIECLTQCPIYYGRSFGPSSCWLFFRPESKKKHAILYFLNTKSGYIYEVSGLKPNFDIWHWDSYKLHISTSLSIKPCQTRTEKGEKWNIFQ